LSGGQSWNKGKKKLLRREGEKIELISGKLKPSTHSQRRRRRHAARFNPRNERKKEKKRRTGRGRRESHVLHRGGLSWKYGFVLINSLTRTVELGPLAARDRVGVDLEKQKNQE